jgi:hypothetical protein
MIKTLMINRSGATYRPIPVTATLGYSQQFPPALAARLREINSQPPTQKLAFGRYREIIPGLARCAGHGIVPAGGCPVGCSKSLLTPIYSDDPNLSAIAKAHPEFFLEPVSDDATENQGSLGRDRDERGRFNRDPLRVQSIENYPDEQMPEAEVRSRLRRVLSHLPKGSKRPFARLCGYRGKWALHTLRGVAKGRAMLPEASRRRLSRKLNQLFRGEWILVKTGMRTTAGRPSHAWRHHRSAPVRHERVPIKL